MSYDTSWHAEARALARAEPHLSYQRMADRLGRSIASVWRVLNPERYAANAARLMARPGAVEKRRACQHRQSLSKVRRGRCASCGELMGTDYKPDGQCEGCRSVVSAARRSVARSMWVQDWPINEIASSLGVTEGTVRNYVKRTRHRRYVRR